MKFFVLFLFWIKRKRQNKDVLDSRVKVAGKQKQLWLKWGHSDVRNFLTDINKLRI